MKLPRVFVAILVSSLLGCGASPEQSAGPSQAGPQANIKAQAATAAGVTAATASVPPTISETVTTTQTKVVTDTTTGTGTRTTTGSNTLTVTRTATGTAVVTANGTFTLTYTGNRTGTLTSSGVVSGTKTASGTANWTGTYLGTGTATGTKTLTATLSGTANVTGRLTLTATGTRTNSGTVTGSGTATASASTTKTLTYTAPATATTTTSSTSTRTASQTATMTDTTTNPCVGDWAFCDNFETGNGAGWNVRQGPVQNFGVIGDGTKVYAQGDSSASQLYISQAGSAWMDATVRASLKPIKFVAAAATSMVTLWGHYDATWGADCGYYVALRGDGKLALGKRVVGVDSPIGAAVPVSGGINAGTWYDVKLEMVDTTLKAYVNGTLLLTQTDTSCSSGSVGVGSVGASFEADNVQVTASATNTCVQDWRNTTCGAFCTYEAGVQSDRAGCGIYLDCYAAHGCSPETCGGQDDVCGVNVLNTWGTASKVVADQVYKCLGCRGSINCGNPKYPNWTMCADGNPCTWRDTCQNGVCVGSEPTTCYALDQCHDIGSCDTTSGKCGNPAKSDGVACDDGNGCTQSDTCQTGVCQGADPIVCAALDVCHVAGTCSSATGTCSNPAKADGELCSQGDTGSCDGGLTCTQPSICKAGVCAQPADVNCADPSVPAGVGCDDGNPCTALDTCQEGACIGTPLTSCGTPVDGGTVDGDEGNGEGLDAGDNGNAID